MSLLSTVIRFVAAALFCVAASIATIGCGGWDYIDAISPAPAVGTAVRPDAAGNTLPADAMGAAETSAADVPLAAEEASVADSQPTGAGADAQSDGAPEEASSPESGPSTTACGGQVAPIRQWTFDSSAENWLIMQPSAGVVATQTWAANTGFPSTGALQYDVNPAGSFIAGMPAHDTGAVFRLNPTVDLSNRTISAWVWLDSGPTPDLKVYVQTTPGAYVWADSGTISLAAHVWTCVSLKVSQPGWVAPMSNYDPTNVLSLGLQFTAKAGLPFRIYVDSVRTY